jgi:hypothetical protein
MKEFFPQNSLPCNITLPDSLYSYSCTGKPAISAGNNALRQIFQIIRVIEKKIIINPTKIIFHNVLYRRNISRNLLSEIFYYFLIKTGK